MASDATDGLPPEAWREAASLLKAWGEDAEFEAALRADARLDAGDLDGAAWWRRVLRALDTLRRPTPQAGDARA